MATPLAVFIPAGRNSVPNASFSRRPGGDCSFSRACARVCSTMGEGFCGCCACAAPSTTAQMSGSRMEPKSAQSAPGIVFRQVAMVPAVTEVHDEADDQPHDQAQPVDPPQLVHHVGVEADAEKRNQWHPWGPKRPGLARVCLAEDHCGYGYDYARQSEDQS